MFRGFVGLLNYKSIVGIFDFRKYITTIFLFSALLFVANILNLASL